MFEQRELDAVFSLADLMGSGLISDVQSPNLFVCKVRACRRTAFGLLLSQGVLALRLRRMGAIAVKAFEKSIEQT